MSGSKCQVLLRRLNVIVLENYFSKRLYPFKDVSFSTALVQLLFVVFTFYFS